MKKLMIAAVAAFLAVPAIAQVTSPDGTVLTNTPEMAAGFENLGLCQSAFRHLRNDQRKSGDRGSPEYNSMSNSEYNQASRETTRCEKINGRYYVVFNANGFGG